MRLRQLGSTQSITFFAPPEVHQSILDVCKKRHGEIIDSSHIISWLLEQTCHTNEQLRNLHLAQGTDFCRRVNAQWKSANFLIDKGHRDTFLKVIQHPERQTLEQLYGEMTDTQPNNSLNNLLFTELRAIMEELNERRRTANSYGQVIQGSVLEEVEQEREVAFQVEEIRQVQKSRHYKALIFPGLHVAVSNFVKTGDLVGGSGYEHAFAAVARTEIGQKHHVCRNRSLLFVSAEFIQTIELRNQSPNDDFLVSSFPIIILPHP